MSQDDDAAPAFPESAPEPDPRSSTANTAPSAPSAQGAAGASPAAPPPSRKRTPHPRTIALDELAAWLPGVAAIDVWARDAQEAGAYERIGRLAAPLALDTLAARIRRSLRRADSAHVRIREPRLKNAEPLLCLVPLPPLASVHALPSASPAPPPEELQEDEDDRSTEERTADALERIAAALEARTATDEVLPLLVSRALAPAPSSPSSGSSGSSLLTELLSNPQILELIQGILRR